MVIVEEKIYMDRRSLQESESAEGVTLSGIGDDEDCRRM